METPPPTDTKAEVQPKDFVTATLPINPESTELLFAGQATINCGSGDQERGVTYTSLKSTFSPVADNAGLSSFV